MKTTLRFMVLAGAVGLAGCGYSPEQRAASGALIGGGTGAVLGNAFGHGPGATIAGGLLGAGTGALIGANTRPMPPPPPRPVVYVMRHGRCVEIALDDYGREYCRARLPVGY